MSKVSFVVRWGIIFSILGFFTLYSVAALSMGSSNKAYAAAISHNNYFRHHKDFVVMYADDIYNNNNGHHGGNHGGGGRQKMICAIDQNQLNSLRAAYSTAVYTTTQVQGQQKGIVEVDKTPHVNTHNIYQTIGLNTRGPNCQIIKSSQSFLLFLLPGVS